MSLPPVEPQSPTERTCIPSPRPILAISLAISFAGLLTCSLCEDTSRPGDAEEVSGDSAWAIQEKLRDTLATLMKLRERYYEQKQADETRIERLAAQVNKLQDQVTDGEQKRKGTLAAIAAREKSILELEKRLEKARSARAALLAALRNRIKEWKSVVLAGIQYRSKERLELLGRIEAELDSDNGSLLTAMELARVFAEGELRDSASGQSYAGDVTLPDGRKKPARFFHLGRLVVGFVTEDGDTAGYGVLTGKENRSIQWVVEPGTRSMREIREAIQMLDRMKAPKLLLLPVNIEAVPPSGQ